MGESIHFLGQRPSSQVARFNLNLSTARPGGSGVWPLAVSKNLGTVFPNKDFPVGNNIHLFHSDTGSFKIRIRWLWGVWILSTRQLGWWYFNISVYRRLIAGWFWWFGGINFVVKFGELSVHRVSLLSLESTQKKKIIDQNEYEISVFFLFWSDATCNRVSQRKEPRSSENQYPDALLR